MISISTVESVTGPIALDDLGFTLMHEHLFTLNSELRIQYPWDEEKIVQRAIDTMTHLRGLGIRTIVDQTTFGLGRDAVRVKRIAAASGMNVIAATGIFAFRDMPTYFRNRAALDEKFIENFFVREIEEGISDTGIKPAILKCVTERHGLTEDVEAILRATARAHRRTGVPISTHTDSKTKQGLTQQRVFTEEGVDLSRVLIGHVGDSTDLDYIEELLAKGSYMGMDRFGDDQVTPVERRIEVVAELCRRGYADRMILSHDTNVESDNTSTDMRAVNPRLRNWKYSYIPETVIPALRQAGVSQDDIETMTVANPRRFLAKGAAY